MQGEILSCLSVLYIQPLAVVLFAQWFTFGGPPGAFWDLDICGGRRVCKMPSVNSWKGTQEIPLWKTFYMFVEVLIDGTVLLRV